MENSILIDLQYLPSIAFFSAIEGQNELILEAEEYFEKQTYRNRCHLLSSQQIEVLTVPLFGANKKIKSKDIKIDNSQSWNKKHWRTIQTCYGKSPFFEFFAEEFKSIYEKKYNLLWDLNFDLLTICLKITNQPIKITESVSYKKSVSGNVIDARSLIHPKKANFLNKFYKSIPYGQSFGNEFESNLSVLDLIMNEGPNTKTVIKQSKIK
ncbi:WbqC family protein [Marivirga arenosa]|uniref:WbqC family protein n=1 Tax=Marivirga arenosa TaxID=3059076 RepID=A0AA51N7E3_9BACT|nr:MULTISPECIES: WbqC family protein [unclassified Marivirga]WKK82223.1 WbqC family protein [Marivirga sp. BKB1-2]WMN07517.1 WbqC family protein [Marivirga sp. ABR2-2]